MRPQMDTGVTKRRPIRGAVIAAALGVAACFGAALTFVGEPARAVETPTR